MTEMELSGFVIMAVPFFKVYCFVPFSKLMTIFPEPYVPLLRPIVRASLPLTGTLMVYFPLLKTVVIPFGGVITKLLLESAVRTSSLPLDEKRTFAVKLLLTVILVSEGCWAIGVKSMVTLFTPSVFKENCPPSWVTTFVMPLGGVKTKVFPLSKFPSRILESFPPKVTMAVLLLLTFTKVLTRTSLIVPSGL